MRTQSRVLSVAVAAAVALAPALVNPSPAVADPGMTQLPSAPAAAEPTPNTDDCPYKTQPAPPVDESEVVQPWESTPSKLPVPTPPVGGEKLSECGVVADPAAGEVPENLSSAGWLIADLDSGDIIAAKDPHGRYRPASTIKTLLALTFLDSDPDLDKVVVGQRPRLVDGG